jgi:hypothetical protein
VKAVSEERRAKLRRLRAAIKRTRDAVGSMDQARKVLIAAADPWATCDAKLAITVALDELARVERALELVVVRMGGKKRRSS